mmetsp:Transcript_71159/g.154663  ORF Transcript_71159/g.154663 Transcript_71159/m.154663 type:complete len:312 (-) Transcript_71159:163-1098(-)
MGRAPARPVTSFGRPFAGATGKELGAAGGSPVAEAGTFWAAEDSSAERPITSPEASTCECGWLRAIALTAARAAASASFSASSAETLPRTARAARLAASITSDGTSTSTPLASSDSSRCKSVLSGAAQLAVAPLACVPFSSTFCPAPPETSSFAFRLAFSALPPGLAPTAEPVSGAGVLSLPWPAPAPLEASFAASSRATSSALAAGPKDGSFLSASLPSVPVEATAAPAPAASVTSPSRLASPLPSALSRAAAPSRFSEDSSGSEGFGSPSGIWASLAKASNRSEPGPTAGFSCWSLLRSSAAMSGSRGA